MFEQNLVPEPPAIKVGCKVGIGKNAGSGKTTLAEALLHNTGAINTLGSVERGNTVCDFDPQEKQLQHSLDAAICSLTYQGKHINLIDYSGYPDCRPAYIEAFEDMANLATRAGVEGKKLKIHAPLINMSKAEIISSGTRLGVDYSLTVSCYQADQQGRACGLCDSCRLRRDGFEAAGVPDPTIYQ